MSFLFSIFATIMIVATSLAFATIYFYKIEKDIAGYLSEKSNSVISENLVFADGDIFFRHGPNGETISARLRDLDISAVIYDAEKLRIGTFGIYKNLADGDNLEKIAPGQLLDTVATSRKPIYQDVTLNQHIYDTFTVPLIHQGTPAGVLQVAKEGNLFTHLTQSIVSVMMVVIPISVGLSWVAGYIISRSSLKPLVRLTAHMQTIDADHMPAKIKSDLNSRDEISAMSKVFNDMIDRVSEGIDKQQAFVANASHEIKTPLTRAISTLDVALTQQISPDLTNLIKEVKGELLGLGETMSSLLLLSSITAGLTQKDQPQHVRVLTAITKTLKQTAALIDEKRITVGIHDELSPVIIFPQRQFTILVNNIINNAVKYNRPEGQITIKTAADNGFLKIIISDTGIGMKNEEVKYIFNRFYRSSRASQVSHGSGLGLALVKEICKKNQLQIQVKSDQEAGTTVVVSGFRLV